MAWKEVVLHKHPSQCVDSEARGGRFDDPAEARPMEEDLFGMSFTFVNDAHELKMKVR